MRECFWKKFARVRLCCQYKETKNRKWSGLGNEAFIANFSLSDTFLPPRRPLFIALKSLDRLVKEEKFLNKKNIGF